MLSRRAPCRAPRRSTSRICGRFRSTLASDAARHLRILFCGADEFSIHSLNALNAYRLTHPEKISSIDVLCRSDKRVGRGRRQIAAVPIKAVAEELQLSLYQLDSFRDWQPPVTDLIVTASFGLLVPAAVLDSARFGGINVHPSLLPNLRGAAPIQHALLNRLPITGVTIQTMHPTKFDHGTVLMQEEVRIQDVNVAPSMHEMVAHLGPIAGSLLVKVIEEGRFINPHPGLTKVAEIEHKAPKIGPSDRKIDWQTWTADEILLKHRALGQLWDDRLYDQCAGRMGDAPTSMTYNGPWTVRDHVHVLHQQGNVALIAPTEDSPRSSRQVAFLTADSILVTPASATVEVKSKSAGLITLQRFLEQHKRARNNG